MKCSFFIVSRKLPNSCFVSVVAEEGPETIDIHNIDIEAEDGDLQDAADVTGLTS